MFSKIIYKLFFSAAMPWLIVGMAGQSRAELINFDDLKFVSNTAKQGLSHFHKLFGSTATGYAGAGFYQITSSGRAPTYALRSNTSGVLGVYDGITFSNFGKTASNGGIAREVSNILGHPADLSKTGGFTFNSISLRSSSIIDHLTISVTGYDGNNHVIYPTVRETNVTWSYRTFTFNWTGVTRVDFAVSGSKYGSKTFYIDNLYCTFIKPVPEPATLAMACIGGFGMIVFTQRRRACYTLPTQTAKFKSTSPA
jgi:hypothetical protein